MSFNAGWNCRVNIGPPPTDGANTSPLLGEIYPFTYSNGVVAGWDVGPPTFDVGGIEPRLYGINYSFTSQHRIFRVDLLTSGTYSFTLALGQQGTLLTGQQMIVKDNTTTLATIGPATSNSFLDATGTSYSTAAWPGSNTPITLVFTTTTAFFDISSSSDNCALAHIFLSQVVIGGSLFRTPPLSGVGIGGPFFRDPLQ